MNTPHSKLRPRSIMGFSLVEAIVMVAVLGLLAAVTISTFSSTKDAVVDTKLRSDVTKLNSLVMIYQASGGSLAGARTPQEVIDALKTTRGSVDAKTTVGPVTGREVDVRLAARMQTDTEAASNAPRAVWNPETQKFEIASGGTAGVASFVLNDALAENDYGNETRSPTNVLYNSEDGWVWKNNNPLDQPSLAPLSPVVSSAGTSYNFDPTAADGGSSTPIVVALPPPSISPRSSVLYLADFVSTVTINAGSIPAGSGIPGYMVTHADGTSTAWAPYAGPITITYGDTVVARNMTTDTARYSDSPTSSESFKVKPTLLPSPVITPSGGSYPAANWPAVTINPNGAPVGASTAISYKITSSRGVSTAWMTYSGPVTTTYGDTVTAKNVSLNAQYYSDSGTVAQTYNVTGSSKLPPPLLTQTTDSTGRIWVTISPDASKFPIPAGARLYYTTDGTDPGVNATEDPLTGAIAYTAGQPVGVKPNAGNFVKINARLYPPTAEKTLWDTSDRADIGIALAPVLFSGDIAAYWKASSGPSGLRSTVNNSNPDEVVERDGTATSSGPGQNIFTFKRQPSFSGVAPDTTFKLGEIVYNNGTIVSGSGSTALSLHLDLTLKVPAVATTGTDIAMKLENTPNTSTGTKSADACTLANPVTDYSIHIAGWTYTLTLSYGNISSSQGFVSGNTLNVWEGATGVVDILAKFAVQ